MPTVTQLDIDKYYLCFVGLMVILYMLLSIRERRNRNN